MQKHLLLTAFLLGSSLLLAAGPTTTPVLSPVPELTSAKEAADKADAAEASARSECEKAFWASPIGKQLAADLATKKKNREAAVASGDIQKKLDSGSALNRSSAAAAAALAKSVAADQRLANAAAAKAAAHSQLAAATQRATNLKAKQDAEQEYNLAHPMFARLKQIRDQPIPANEGKPGDYSYYSVRTQKIIDAINAIKDEKYPKREDYALAASVVNEIYQAWRKDNTEIESAYASAVLIDAANTDLKQSAEHVDMIYKIGKDIGSAMRLGPHAADRLYDDQRNNREDYLMRLKSAKEIAEKARQSLVTREGTRPAVPN